LHSIGAHVDVQSLIEKSVEAKLGHVLVDYDVLSRRRWARDR